MCEAKVYIHNGQEEKVMDDVVLIQPEGDTYLLVNVLGEQKLVRGRISRIDFLHHTVHLASEPAPESS